MAFQNLVGGECGGNNSLVQFSNILSRDSSVQAGPSGSQANQYVNEFLVTNSQMPPQTFQMNTLLQSLKELHGDKAPLNLQNDQWVKDFQNTSKLGPGIEEPAFWNGPHQSMHQNLGAPRMMQNNFSMGPNFMNRPQMPLQYMNETFDTSNYLIQNTVSKDEVREKAKELVDSIADQDIAYSEFVNYMRKIGSGEASLVTPDSTVPQIPKEQVLNPNIEKFAENNQEEWNKLKKEMEHPWLSTVNFNTNPYPTYNFAQQNNMIENPNALEIGKQKLKLGDVPGAVLCFEASVQQSPTLIEGWLLLGTTQAENEQDPQAIAALSKCIELDPTCLEAYMTLGSSYTNENYSNFAYKAFNDWLKANKKYSDLVPLDVDIANMSNMQLQEHIQSLFIRAAQMNPLQVDPDIQCALGVLFNISQEYGKAVDCFKSALMVKGDDSRLWNKLGATLANGERSEEAVDAYYQALALEPGFIRARYNIGITCMNLGAYKEAAEHYLTALNQQAKAQGVLPNVSRENMSSSTIWSTLRMVCAFMGKHELTPLIDDRNLEELNRHFEIV